MHDDQAGGTSVEMRKPEEYRRHATECLELASAFQSPEARAILLHMAQTWFRLADEGDHLNKPVANESRQLDQ